MFNPIHTLTLFMNHILLTSDTTASACTATMQEHEEASLTDHTYKNIVCLNDMNTDPSKSNLYLIQLHLVEKPDSENEIEVKPIYNASAYVDYKKINAMNLTTIDAITPMALDIDYFDFNYILSCDSKANFINIKPHHWDFVLMLTLSDDPSLNLPAVEAGKRSNVCRRTLEKSSVSSQDHSVNSVNAADGSKMKCFMLDEQEQYTWFYCLIKKLEFGKNSDLYRCRIEETAN